MKKKFFSQLMMAAFVMSPLTVFSAQDNCNIPTYTTSSPEAGVKYYGSNNAYRIGSQQNPVTASEYCDFLQGRHAASLGRLEGNYWLYSDYYDIGFMSTDQDWFPFSDNCIQRKGSYSYRYSVIPGHEKDIIVALYSATAQKEFNFWRKECANNPTEQEVCDYLNDMMKAHEDPSYQEEAHAIAARYPNVGCVSAGPAQDKNHPDPSLQPSFITLWDDLNELADNLYQYGSAYKLSNVLLTALELTLSSSPDTETDKLQEIVLLDKTKKDIRRPWSIRDVRFVNTAK